MSKNKAKKSNIGILKKLTLIIISLLCFVVAIGLMFHRQILEAYNKFKKDKDISAELTELNNGENPEKLLQVHFIDVGQGDATLITYDGHAMLIDGGDNSKGTAIQKYLMDNGIEKLDYVIGTHPDADHIGGLDVIIYKFNCDNIIMPDVGKDTKSYEDLIMSIEEKDYEIINPKEDMKLYMGDVEFTVLSPNKDKTYEDINDYSIVLRMEYKDISFIFAGDAGKLVMEDILTKDVELDCDVYKVAHHGSADSYCEDFYNKMSPAYMIISCGKDNDYNHPHKEIMDYIDKNNIITYRTDQNGDIVAYTDGEKIAWITE